MFSAFSLQQKRLRSLRLPWMSIGSCEMMNSAAHFDMANFLTTNHHNRNFYDTSFPVARLAGHREGWHVGDVVAAGLMDSFTGPWCSRFISEYLQWALSLHCAVPANIKALQTQLQHDPIMDVMKVAMMRTHRAGPLGKQRTPSQSNQILTEWEMRQYAILADSSFFQKYRGKRVPLQQQCGALSRGPEGGDPAETASIDNSGCRAVWFTAALAPADAFSEAGGKPSTSMPPPSVNSDPFSGHVIDVVVSNVGDSRCFGIARHPLTKGIKSLLDNDREKVYPLSSDHKPSRADEYRRILQAGGTTGGPAGDCIDGSPFLNVSRSFGHRMMKDNEARSPVEQKMIAAPSCVSWEMREGDIIVMANHAVYETRSDATTTVDVVAKVVTEELQNGSTPEEAAGALCDYAMRFGASHSLQVVIAVAQSNLDVTSPEGCFAERVVPGPIYVEPCQMFPEYFEALEADCERCSISVAELLQLRWERVKDVLSKRSSLPLLHLYGKECGALQQIMSEEAQFFGDGPSSLPRAHPTESDEMRDARYFHGLARSLQPARRTGAPREGGMA